MDRPHRTHEIAIRVGADDLEYLMALLQEIFMEFDAHGPRKMFGGGYSGNYITVYASDYDVTHDSYFEEVDKWIEEQKKKEESQNV